MNPLISIVVPIYNVEKYIHKCVDSIINQTYKEIEIILVDDGSPDNCGSICDEYSQKDDRIKVIHQKNKGLSGARNSGTNIAKGEYIAFIDSDDYIVSNMYELLLNKILTTKSDVAICNFRESKSTNYPFEKNNYTLTTLDQRETFQNYLDYGFYVWRNLYKRTVIESVEFKEDILFVEDIFFGADIISKITKSVFIDLPLYIYNVDNMTSLTKVNYNKKKFTSLDANVYLKNKIKYIFPSDYILSEILRKRILENCLFHLQNLFKGENESLDPDNNFIKKTKQIFNNNFKFTKNRSLFKLIVFIFNWKSLKSIYYLKSLLNKNMYHKK